MILENFLGGLLARVPKQLIWPAITAVLLTAGISAVWLALNASHAAQLAELKEQNANLKLEVQKERKRSDSLTVVIIVDKTNRINEQAEDNRRLAAQKEEVDDYVYENQLREEINRKKARASNQAAKRIFNKKDS